MDTYKALDNDTRVTIHNKNNGFSVTDRFANLPRLLRDGEYSASITQEGSIVEGTVVLHKGEPQWVV